MTALAPHLSNFLREHLPKQRRASQHTCEAYAQSFQLLLGFAASRLKMKPSKIEIERLDASLILAFLEHLEKKRGNSARTRNARLAAINSFFRFLEYKVPSCLNQARRIHAIPMKKTNEALVSYLTRDELQALLDAPDTSTVSGIRDRAMLHLTFAAGLRVSELVGLRLDQIDHQGVSTVHIIGKGRRERILPLWKETAAAVKAWLKVRAASAVPELFLNARGQAMTRDGFEYILAKHVATASRAVPAIARKRVSPHVLRHTCAMHTLQATRDVRKVSLWLGHAGLESTEVYLRADPTEKLEALTAMTPPMLKPGRFRAPDKVMAMLSTAGRKPDYAECEQRESRGGSKLSAADSA
jgi:site-specific recombinase XerD